MLMAYVGAGSVGMAPKCAFLRTRRSAPRPNQSIRLGTKKPKSPMPERLRARQSIQSTPTDAAAISEVIQLALSDHVSFNQILQQYGLSADEVQDLMRRHLKRGSYVAWRKRVRLFSERRERYK